MRSDAPVLGFDCAAAHCAGALVVADQVIAARRIEMARGQVEHLMPMLGDLLTQAGHDWRDLAAIGVGTGPGNFTGTRIAISAARGLALGLGIAAIGVSTLEAQALGIDGPCVSLVGAPRDQIYVQAFDAGTPAPPAFSTLEGVRDLDLPLAGAVCIGHHADAIAARIGGAPRPAPDNIAEAIARIAAARRGGDAPRPAPLYLAPTGAAPATDTPPTILP